MINAAVIENNTVINRIYIDQENLEAFVSKGMELIDSNPLSLSMGDYREEDAWYRDVDGVKTALPIEPEPAASEQEDMQHALQHLGVEPEEGREELDV